MPLTEEHISTAAVPGPWHPPWGLAWKQNSHTSGAGPENACLQVPKWHWCCWPMDHSGEPLGQSTTSQTFMGMEVTWVSCYRGEVWSSVRLTSAQVGPVVLLALGSHSKAPEVTFLYSTSYYLDLSQVDMEEKKEPLWFFLRALFHQRSCPTHP